MNVAAPVGATAARSATPAIGLGHFTIVMATGIVSASVRDLRVGWLSGWLSTTLTVLAAAAFAVLLVGSGVASWATRRRGGAGPTHQLMSTGFAVLAFPAAANVLAALFFGAHVRWLGLGCAVIGFVSWLILGYLAVANVAIGHTRLPRRRRGLLMVDGTWFLLAVATQSMTIALCAVYSAYPRPDLVTAAYLTWSLGLFQLLLLSGLIFARLLIAPISPDEEVAPFWVFMGSGAITVLASAELIHADTPRPLLDTVVVSTVGMGVWAFATWLIPLLIAMVAWQHRRGERHWYRLALWSMVFPIGMYGEASRVLGEIRHTHWLTVVANWEGWVALIVWAAVAAGLAQHAVRARRCRICQRGVSARRRPSP